LKDNHVKWHIFFNDLRFHNHAAHRAIAVWALGANESVIHAGYDNDIKYEKPAFKSPEEITIQNFYDHLGDDKYFNAYMNFFTCYVQEKGISGALEDFIFSPKANLGAQTQLALDEQPQMLNRFLAGVLHPTIHTGYGAEFNLLGMVVEGLAQTAVHLVSTDLLGPLKLFEVDQVINKETVVNTTSETIGSAFSAAAVVTALGTKILPQGSLTVENIQPKASSTKDSNYAAASSNSDGNIHALTILARIMRDSNLDPPSTPHGEREIYNATIEKNRNGIAEHVHAWTINVAKLGEGDQELNRKIEEVAWVICVLYGIGGWTCRAGGSGGQFNADFFLMHLVTSSIFLPSLCAFLSPSSKACFLRAYFATVCTWYVTRGRPALDIAGFFSQEISLPSGLDPDPRKGGVPNLWIPLLQSGMAHSDEHLIKTQRALSCWAQKFGAKRARVPIKNDLNNLGLGETTASSSAIHSADAATLNGCDTMPITELPGSEHLDGTLFLRTGLLTADRLGWIREGQELGKFWDFEGFFTETK
jgi:hypothetical protein